MLLLDAKNKKPNPFEIRKQLFFRLIQKNGIMKRSVMIDLMSVTVDRFQREYKSYMESFDSHIVYDERTQSFLFDVGDVVIDYDYCTGRIQEQKQHVSHYTQQTIVS